MPCPVLAPLASRRSRQACGWPRWGPPLGSQAGWGCPVGLGSGGSAGGVMGFDSLHGDIVALRGWRLSLCARPHTLLHNPPKSRGPRRPHISFTPPPHPFPGTLPRIPVLRLLRRAWGSGLRAQTRTWAPGQLPRRGPRGTSCSRCVPCQPPAAGGPAQGSRDGWWSARHWTRGVCFARPPAGPLVRGVGVLLDACSRVHRMRRWPWRVGTARCVRTSPRLPSGSRAPPQTCADTERVAFTHASAH